MTDQSDLARLTASFREYVKLQTEILKLELVQRASELLAKLVFVLLLVLAGMLVLILVTISAGFYLGELLKSTGLGFLALGGIYLLLFVIIFLFGNKLIMEPMKNKIIAGLLGGDKNA